MLGLTTGRSREQLCLTQLLPRCTVEMPVPDAHDDNPAAGEAKTATESTEFGLEQRNADQTDGDAERQLPEQVD